MFINIHPVSLVNFGGKLPLDFYNLLNEEIHKREDGREYGHGPGVNQALANPHTFNRPSAWPVKIKASMSSCYQVHRILLSSAPTQAPYPLETELTLT